MTSPVLEQFSEEDSTISTEINYNRSVHQYPNVLRSKEKKARSKCNKILKRKLKKYKIRQDGTEDQDILDVSGILESSLTIKSPSEKKSLADLELEQLTPTNYLFKMGRKKQAIIVAEKSVNSKSGINMVNDKHVNGFVQLSPTTEEKKQTNAFKLLMDSRNKSLGTNSPGKEKPIDETDMQNLIDKKNDKAKRKMVLEKMAESKGSLKKKEIEENQAKYIDKKMKNRADRLKNMISNIEPKSLKAVDTKTIPILQNGRKPLNNLKTEKNDKHSEKVGKSLQLVNMFTDVEQKTRNENKHFCKEDDEFLKKLSPSLKKKESMLSYFPKVEKEPDCTVTDNENNVVIKVKIGNKLKKKRNKKKLSLNRDNSTDVAMCEVETIKPDQQAKTEVFSDYDFKKAENITSKERRKRKREIKPHNCDDGAVSSLNILDDACPRRSAKRPVKYNEGACPSSSDEELHIFTPKKKKHLGNNEINKTKILDISSEDEEKKETTKKSVPEAKVKKSKIPDKKSVKLAPIFSTKTQLDPAAMEAKQKFLQSGVPDKLKKIMSKQVDKTTVSNCFLKVVHIQQLDVKKLSNSVQLSPIEHNTSLDDHNDNQTYGDPLFNTLSKMLNITISPKPHKLSSKIINVQVVLQNLKQKYPRYPVYRTYRLLRGKKKGDNKVGTNYLDLDNSMEILNVSIDNQNDNPDQLSWSDKYKPLAASQIIGNFESVKELRKWLVSWTENNIKSKMANGNDSDSSDFCYSDGDSKDSMKSSKNLMVLAGPVGSGKTSSVYAIAAELSIKVIEVNASSRRTGKIMLQDLQEATQSHKVNRQANSNENSQNSQKSEINDTPIHMNSNPVKKRGRPKKNVEVATPVKPVLKKTMSNEKSGNLSSASQDMTRTGMSLILIDDADIVFDQDDGFCSAIVQLVHSSKRPVILITSTLSCQHLQRFIQSGQVLKMNPLLPNILGTWLDIMCLADSGACWPGIGSKALNVFKGDVRKTINYLQFYVCSQEQVLRQRTESCSQNADYRLNVDDENSNISWADRDGEDKISHDDVIELSDPSKNVILQQINSMQHRTPNKLFNIWWSVPKLLSTSDQSDKIENATINKSSKSLESISQVLDSISLCDLYSDNLRNRGNLTSDPWFSEEAHSVSEIENFETYDRHYGTRKEIACEIMNRAISCSQAELGCNRDLVFDFPGMSQHRQRNRIVARHNNLTSSLSPHAVLDRKALALDYWPSCRTICRIEKSKTDTNSKRNNRFCHYLKSLSVLCKNDSFDKLASSLCPSEVHHVTEQS